MPELCEWELPRGGVLQVFVDPQRAGHGSTALVVDNLDDQVRELEAHKIEVTSRQNSPQNKLAVLSDPDGNRVVLVEPMATAS